MVQQLQIIGLDGCDPILLSKWEKEGRLPTFSRIFQEGINKKLQSTIPPTTFPAWITMFTGKNPGRLGIFDFFDLVKTEIGFSQQLFSTSRWSGDYIWDIAGQHGKTTGIINIPFFMPTKVNGYMIDTHMSKSYPQDLLHNLSTVVEPVGKFDTELAPLKKDEIERIRKNTIIEFKLSEYLRQNNETDIFIQVFNILDSTAHCTPDFNILRNRYVLIDKLLGEYFDFDRKNTIIVSDHGMKKIRKRFYINKWLIDAGLLTLKRDYESEVESIFNKIVYQILDYFPSLETLFEDFQARLMKKGGTSVLNTEKIDWANTYAYSHSSNACGYAGLWLTKKGANEIERVMRVLRNCRTKNDRQIIKSLFLSNQIYRGSNIDKLPQIVVELVDDILAMASFSPVAYRSSNSFAHSLEGIFIASGPDVNLEFGVETVRMSDVACTVLSALKLPSPINVDGEAHNLFM